MSQKPTSGRSKRVFISRAGWFSLHYPSGWDIEEEEYVAVYNPKEGVGALHISAYQAPESVDPKAELMELMSKENREVKLEHIETSIDGTKTVASYESVSAECFEKAWFVGDGSYLLIATYNCDVEDKQKELSKIEDIISSIKIAPKLSRN